MWCAAGSCPLSPAGECLSITHKLKPIICVDAADMWVQTLSQILRVMIVLV